MQRDDNCYGCGVPGVHASGLRGFSSFGELTLPSLSSVPTPALIGAVAGYLFGGRTIMSAAMGGALGYFISKQGVPALPGQGLITLPAGGGPTGSPKQLSPTGGGPISIDNLPSDLSTQAMAEIRKKLGLGSYGDDVDQTQADETGGQWWTQQDQQGQPEEDAQWCAVEDEESMIEATMSAEEDTAATDALVHAREMPPAAGGGVVPHLIGAGAGFLLAGPLGAAAGALLPFLTKKP